MAALATMLTAESPARTAGVTIVLDFQGPRSERSVQEMKREFEGILKSSGLAFEWRMRDEANQVTSNHLVVVRFKGKCVLEPVGYLYDERGPLAFTYSTDGAVQPYSEVACDKVASSIRSAMFGGDFANADEFLGRALGRVLAHELVHMLSKSRAHARSGVEKAALSGKLLIAPDMRLDAADLEKLHTLVQ
ncbi:MAG TPA: hypothetical protein VNY05_35470 [Candidatus Acidoferrales bacterium]|nr:hypothetical protein [Candidatus Acidoferrales bacterium]